MHRVIFVVLVAFVSVASAQTLSQPALPSDGKSVVSAEAKLSGDTLTLSEAKTMVATHRAEKAKIEAARQAVFKKGAKATPEERAKLIADFRKAQQASLTKLQADAPRVRELEEKIKVTEKAAPPSVPAPAPKS